MTRDEKVKALWGGYGTLYAIVGYIVVAIAATVIVLL